MLKNVLTSYNFAGLFILKFFLWFLSLLFSTNCILSLLLNLFQHAYCALVFTKKTLQFLLKNSKDLLKYYLKINSQSILIGAKLNLLGQILIFQLKMEDLCTVGSSKMGFEFRRVHYATGG